MLPSWEFVNRRQGNNCFPDSLDAAEIPFSVIPFLNLTKTTTTQILEIAIFLIQLGALSPWQCSFLLGQRANGFQHSSHSNASWRLEEVLGAAYGYFSRLRLSPSHSCWGREQSKQRRAELRRDTELPRGADSEKLHYPCQAWGQADLPVLFHTQTLPPPPMYPSWWAMKMLKCRVEWVLSPSLMLTSPTAKWRQPGPGSVIYTLAVNRKTPVWETLLGGPATRLHKSIMAAEVCLLEGLGVHFVSCLFVCFYIFPETKETYMAENNPFSFLGIEKARTTALNFVVMWCLNQQKLRESSSTGWSRAAKIRTPVSPTSQLLSDALKTGHQLPPGLMNCLIYMQHHDFH